MHILRPAKMDMQKRQQGAGLPFSILRVFRIYGIEQHDEIVKNKKMYYRVAH
jgi:hypothetical protein